MQALKRVVLSCAIVFSASIGNIDASFADDGAKAYKRCAACHLPSGKGVPGAFPPINERLTSLMATKEGRDYLVMVLNSGLMGPITVNGIQYRSVMQAQGAALKPKGIADVLNYIATTLSTSSEAVETFTVEEVNQIKAEHPKFNANKVYGLRKAAFGSED